MTKALYVKWEKMAPNCTEVIQHNAPAVQMLLIQGGAGQESRRLSLKDIVVQSLITEVCVLSFNLLVEENDSYVQC